MSEYSIWSPVAMHDNTLAPVRIENSGSIFCIWWNERTQHCSYFVFAKWNGSFQYNIDASTSLRSSLTPHLPYMSVYMKRLICSTDSCNRLYAAAKGTAHLSTLWHSSARSVAATAPPRRFISLTVLIWLTEMGSFGLMIWWSVNCHPQNDFFISCQCPF